MKNRKMMKKILAFALAALMILSAVPVMALSVGADSTETTQDSFYKIVHLDCGRKYFTPDWIKSLIDEMAKDGYTHLELAVGNDGLRFLLDDMSLTVGETTYSSEDVKAGIQAGNIAYNNREGYSPSVNELTQAEMDDIITYAHNSGIQIIPLINTPGHMDAIVTCMSDYYLGISNAAYNGSARTVDVTNAQAVAFTQALVEKYAVYFAAKGCTEFNMGADEYANDVYTSGGMGFGQLVSAGQYDDFANYVNDMATVLKSHGLTPMAFNDGIYYGNQTTISFDTDIMIAYWSSGWGSYSVASASYLAGKGFKMINTNGDFYYVLGKSDQFDSGSSYASNWNNETFMGSTVSNPAGAMFCIWCDYPGAETEDTITTKVITAGVLSAMSEAIGDATPVVFPATVTSDLGVVSATAVGLTGITCKETTGPEIAGAAEVKAYEVTLSTDEGQYTGSATVTIAVPEDWTRVRGGVEATAYGEAVQGITGTLDTTAHTFTFTVPHFSTVYVYNLAADAVEVTESKTISIVAGGTATDTISGVNFAGTYTTEDEAVATVVVTGEDGQEASTVYTAASVTCNDLISSNKNKWTAVSGYYYTPDGTNYYPVYAKRSRSYGRTYTYTWGYSETDSSSDVTQIGKQTTYTGYTPNITVYTKSVGDPVPASTTVTFTAAADAAGKTTYVTIGNTRYTIHVVAEDLSEVSPLAVEYWITNGPVRDSDGNTELSLGAVYAYSEEGVAVSSLIPSEGTKGTRTLSYWRCRILDTTLANSSTSGTEEQTETSGDDDTFSGQTFTKVRYWGGNWQVYTENDEWVTVESKHQLVAYFLEILPVAKEMLVLAADWGKKGDGSTSGDYLLPSTSCTVSVQIVYEDGTTNPATTTASDLASSTIAYGYWSGGRGVGTLFFNGQGDYQIWKVEAQTGEMEYDSSSSTWGSFTVSNFTWDDNPLTVYEGDPVDTYAIHNDSNNPSKDGYYANLMWDENYEAILITVYVKAVAKEDSLKVVYVDESFGSTLYEYHISVNAGVTFKKPLDMNDEGRFDASSLTIENILGVTQNIETDLNQLPEISSRFDADLYSYQLSDLSEDGKTLYLYYTVDTSVFAATIVMDFAKPVSFELKNILPQATNPEEWSVIPGKATYGTLAYDSATGKFTYTVTRPARGMESLSIQVKGAEDNSYITINVGVLAATNIYVEDDFSNFITYTGDWTVQAGRAGEQSLTLIQGGISKPTEDVYGYDGAYLKDNTTFSSGGYHAVTVPAGTAAADRPTASFSFWGTGFDIISRTGANQGLISVEIVNSDTGKTVRTLSVINKGDVELYQIPVISVQDLDYAQYTVKITVYPACTISDKNGNELLSYGGEFYLDAVRLYNPVNTQAAHEIYAIHGEDTPTYVEAGDLLSEGFTEDGKPTEGQVGMVIDMHLDEETRTPTYSLAEYQTAGPNNEIYLDKYQAVAFKLTWTGSGVLDIGAKMININGEETGNNAVLNVAVYQGDKEITLKGVNVATATSMFYRIIAKGGEIAEGEIVVVISNTGEAVLSVTDIKYTGNTTVEPTALNEDDMVYMAKAVTLFMAPVENQPVLPEKPVTPEEPVIPEKPVTPEKPVAPEKPVTPAKKPVFNGGHAPHIPGAHGLDPIVCGSRTDAGHGSPYGSRAAVGYVSFYA